MVRLCAAEGRSKQLLKRRFRCDRHFARIWVQLGCNKSSRGFLRAPKVAIGAVKLQSVTSGCCSATAEVASSSLVVPAISFQGVTGRDTGNSNPRFHAAFLPP